MRPRTLVLLASALLFALSGCDLVSDMDGPRPEDFAVEDDQTEVRSGDAPQQPGDDEMRHDVATSLAAARSGVTLSLDAQVTSAR